MPSSSGTKAAPSNKNTTSSTLLSKKHHGKGGNNNNGNNNSNGNNNNGNNNNGNGGTNTHNNGNNEEDDDDLYRQPVKNIIRPVNQLELSEQQLSEEFSIVLTATDPNISSNIVKYNYKEKAYKLDPEGPMDHLTFHFQMNGFSLHKESEEANQQKALEDEAKHNADKLTKELQLEAQEIGDEGMDINLIRSGKSQFNYNDRAAQTINVAMKSRGVSTERPDVVRFVSSVTQWDIYDTYITDYKQHLLEEENNKGGEKKKAAGVGNDLKRGKDADTIPTERMGASLKVLERMLNQNADDEIFQDFKYWEDESDSFRSGLGSLLPLWKFSSEKSRKKHVTSLKWNNKYHDFFAIGYGSYDFLQQDSGLIHCFSLKNTSHPEYQYVTESGVMCLDFHPQHHSLLAVGCYDGSVMVYDIRLAIKKPLYSANVKTGKHTDPVWQVQWQEEEIGKDLGFYSVSSDGQIASWSMTKNELRMELLTQLKLSNGKQSTETTTSTTIATGTMPSTSSTAITISAATGGTDVTTTTATATTTTTTTASTEDVSFTGLAGGCCFDFSCQQQSDQLFLVGTEEGKIHKCSKAYSGQYLETYIGHHMPVYTIKWNPFHPDVFISCSADWHVHIWDQSVSTPILSFDLENPVGDVAWSPFSSTTFAAVTSDGKVVVYDLFENKQEPLCEQKVIKKAKLTHVAFNQIDPILIVGDDRGTVLSLKLSPNLRKTKTGISTNASEPQDNATAPCDNADTPITKEAQIEKLEKILQSARL